MYRRCLQNFAGVAGASWHLRSIAATWDRWQNHSPSRLATRGHQLRPYPTRLHRVWADCACQTSSEGLNASAQRLITLHKTAPLAAVSGQRLINAETGKVEFLPK